MGDLVLRRALRGAGLLALTAAFAACDGGSSTGPGPEPGDGARTATVNAASGWAFVNLGAAQPVVTVANPGTSDTWDIAFNATSVMLNGGNVGPAGVTGHCLCQNAGATDAQVMAMTAATEQADFEAVTTASVPAAGGTAWVADTLRSAFSGWYDYNPTTHQISVSPTRVWKVRTAEGTAYAKLRIVSLAGATQQAPGTVTLEFAVQAAAGAAFGPTRTLQVPVPGTAPVHVDLVRGAVSDQTDWDLAFHGWELRVNGGSSGTGQAGATLLAGETDFAALATASDLAATGYRTDAAGGVFNVRKWYRYNLTGTDHQIWPTYDVYLVRRGGTVWKVQVTGYYGATGEARHISLRWAQVAG